MKKASTSVSIEGAFDSENTFHRQNTLVLDWQITANREGLTLRYAQGLRLAYDNTVLQLMRWDGGDVIPDDAVDIAFQPISPAGRRSPLTKGEFS